MDEVLLESLTHKFSELFKNISSLQEKRETVQDENEHLKQLIQEEQDQLEMNSGESSDDEITIQEIEQRWKQKLEEKKESDMQMKEENNLKSQLYMYLEGIQNEIIQMRNSIEQSKESEADLQQRIEETTQKIDEYQNKIQRAEQIKLQVEKQLQEQNEKYLQDSEKVKAVQAEVRNQLQANAMGDKRQNELEKIIQKQWEELQKRSQRIQVLQNNMNIISTKIQKSQKSENIYQKLKDENTILAQENIQIREKLNQLISALPQHMKKGNVKGKQKSKKEFLELYDESICSNQIKLRHLEQIREEHQSNINSLHSEILQLEEKYNQMTQNVKNLQEQYLEIESSCREFNEEEYVKKNCPNYYKVKKGK
ncbi:unnamed protein product [Paramecium primaurelia]|uniref:Uncharacterized protein n=2 Tax=Paramecium TaxID=5884 RepID=A0A8S1UZR9_9CILI|nr:unnamed protein product [Paramecium primaurelia]CAD8169767.1 unnamed protein product [Paramecium pentaurelia]